MYKNLEHGKVTISNYYIMYIYIYVCILYIYIYIYNVHVFILYEMSLF